MNRTAVLIALVLFSFSCFSQLLEGEWKGYFTMGGVEFTKTEILISFYKIDDTSFEGFAKTIIKNDTAISILTGGFLKKNILYIEESRIIKDFPWGKGSPCLQMFKLYYRQKKQKIMLDGNWVSRRENCGSGTITLTKQL